MRAMILKKPGSGRLKEADVPRVDLAPGQVRVKVRACGVCRTDLHVVDGELPEPKHHIVPGHEIVGEVIEVAKDVDRFQGGERVGVPWLGFACGKCRYCRTGRENLCDEAQYTGYQIDGGYADECVADARFVFPISKKYSDAEAAPLLCAGLIGYRAYRMAKEGMYGGRRLGLYGFGAAAHILTQVAGWEGCKVFGFTRPGDKEAQAFAKSLGAHWVGNSDEMPRKKLDAAVIFAPAGELVPAALKAVKKGGTVVCAGIHMSDIPSFPYADLWEERIIRSVANLTRKDAEEFLKIAPKVPVETHVTTYPLTDANNALSDLRDGKLQGAAVLIP